MIPKIAFLLTVQVFISLGYCCAQPTAGFLIPTTACLNESVQISNTSVLYAQSIWDFCHNDLKGTPVISTITNLPATGSFFYHSIRIVRSNGVWIGFASDASGAKLYRLNFGEDLTSIPQIEAVGNLGGALTSPGPLDVIEENGVWYIFILNIFQNKVARLTMGNGLLQNPTVVTDMNNLGTTLSTPIGIKIIQGSANLLFVSNLGNNTISVVDFGTSFSGSPSTSRILSNALINQPGGIDVTNTGNGWKAVISSFQSNSKVVVASFGSDLSSAPTYSELGSIADGRETKIVKEGLEYSVFVRSEANGVYRARLNADFIITEPLSKITTNALQNASRSLEVIRDTPHWKVFTVEATSGGLLRLDFSSECQSQMTISTSADESPDDFKYLSAGEYYVELTVSDENKVYNVASKNISVSSHQAPQGEVEISENRCVNHSSGFHVATTAQLVSYTWNFDDLTTASDESPQHIYANAGSYNISVQIVDAAGCGNTVVNSIDIYDQPEADFTLPGGVLCTNNDVVFENTTVDNFDGLLRYYWYENDELLSSSRNLSYQFLSTGTKTIKLVTSIPGCSTQMEKTTAEFKSGPPVDFSFSGQCDGLPSQFQEQISESVQSYSWHFPENLTITDDDNPEITFSAPGSYNVTLEASSLNGCNNSKTRVITIYSKPTPNFSIEAPPQSCSGTPTPFQNATPDLTDSNITSWRWTFGDANSGSNISELKSPSHVFANAGTYKVLLKAKTDKECEATLEKEIAIAQSPNAEFSNTSTCKEVPSTFTSSGGDIKTYYWEIGTSYYLNKSVSHTFNAAGEYDVKLSVTGTNNCNSFNTKRIKVPVPLTPSFSVWKNCVGYEAEFKDNTSGLDPVTWRQWNFDGTIKENVQQTKFPISEYKMLPTTLTVKGESGCVYSKHTDVNVLQAPMAKFEITPLSGAAPLEVSIENLSESATKYKWTFFDATSSTSEEFEPTYTFNQVGEHAIELKAANQVGCENVISKTISAENPAADVEIKVMTVSQNPDKTLKVIVTLQNNGNTILRDLPVNIDISGVFSFKEIIEEPIRPKEQYNLVLSYGITKSQDLNFLCAQAELAGDLTFEGNKVCTQFEKTVLFLSPYPNPVTETLNIEWIGKVDHRVNILITDSFGKAILQKDIESIDGFNHQFFDVTQLKEGLYFLVINDGVTQKTQRIIISHKN